MTDVQDVKKIHEKYEAEWRELKDTLPDCSATIEHIRKKLLGKMYAEIDELYSKQPANKKCPKCGKVMVFTEDEETGEQWWYCPNPDCPNLEHYEPDSNCDGGRLLNADEFQACATGKPAETDVEKCAEPWIFGAKLIKAQDAKTASIKDKECKDLRGLEQFIMENHYRKEIEKVRAECQERVERILETLLTYHSGLKPECFETTQYPDIQKVNIQIPISVWQALKQREGIE